MGYKTKSIGYYMSARLFLLFLLLTISIESAAAENNNYDDLFDLSFEELFQLKVQSVTKSDILLKDSPVPSVLITRKEIERSSARSVGELLRNIPGVNVRWNPMMQTIDIRGFGQNPFTNRVLLLIDGVPYNSWNKGGFPQHPGTEFFPLENIKQIEIIKSPGSSLYGENAFWGVINIISLSADDHEGGSFRAYGGSFDTYSTTLRWGGEPIKDVKVFSSVKWLKQRLPIQFWDDSNADIESINALLKVQYGGFELFYNLFADESDQLQRDLTAAFDGQFESAVYSSAPQLEQTVNIVGAKYSYAPENGDIEVHWSASFANRNGSHCAGCHGAQEFAKASESENHGFQLLSELRSVYKAIEGHEITFGIEGRRVDSGGHSSELGATPLDGHDKHGASGPGHDPLAVLAYNKTAIYGQDKIDITDWASLVVGARYDTRTYPRLFDDQLSPRVAGLVKLSEDLRLRASWSTAFHFPDFSTLYQNTQFLAVETDQGPLELARFVPNGNLKPESIRRFDIGLEYTGLSNLILKADLFTSELKDFIVMINQGEDLGWGNHPGDVRDYGGELSALVEATEWLQLFAGYAYQRQDQQGDARDAAGKLFEFVYSPRHKVNLGTYLNYEKWQMSVNWNWKDTQEAPSFWNLVVNGQVPFETVPLSSYGLLNAQISRQIPELNTTLKLYASNILDEQQAETLVGFDSSLLGRIVVFQAQVNF